ncbi:MAG: hypothetical protein NDF54_08400 [archaeon GB-1867-035]|nr:hypothetical protein [Candidatus Culexmicrobium profundum]
MKSREEMILEILKVYRKLSIFEVKEILKINDRELNNIIKSLIDSGYITKINDEIKLTYAGLIAQVNFNLPIKKMYIKLSRNGWNILKTKPRNNFIEIIPISFVNTRKIEFNEIELIRDKLNKISKIIDQPLSRGMLSYAKIQIQNIVDKLIKICMESDLKDDVKKLININKKLMLINNKKRIKNLIIKIKGIIENIPSV